MGAVLGRNELKKYVWQLSTCILMLWSIHGDMQGVGKKCNFSILVWYTKFYKRVVTGQVSFFVTGLADQG